MNLNSQVHSHPRSLETIFRDNIENAVECGKALTLLFSNLAEAEPHIAQVKHLEERGDKLTAEAYNALEVLPYSEFVHLTEQFVKRLDDIVDGINNTARIVDICSPRKVEDAAQELLSNLLSIIAALQSEINQFPENELASVKRCRETVKGWEENADLVYHQWRKTQRRLNALPLVDESNWTEILGILEQTTDAGYHAVLLLERMTRYRLRQSN